MRSMLQSTTLSGREGIAARPHTATQMSEPAFAIMPAIDLAVDALLGKFHERIARMGCCSEKGLHATRKRRGLRRAFLFSPTVIQRGDQ